MTTQSKKHTTPNDASKLDQFDLKYELDVDWAAARAATRKHTTK